MAKTKSGILYLTKKDIKNLEVLIKHTKADISYGEGGSFNCEGKNGEYPFDEKEAKKAKDAINIINFIIKTQ